MFFFSSRRRHTRWNCDWSSDVCSSDLWGRPAEMGLRLNGRWRKPTLVQLVAATVVASTTLLVVGSKFGRRRSEERRVGKECSSRWLLSISKKKCVVDAIHTK